MIVSDTLPLRTYLGLLERVDGVYTGHLTDNHGARIELTARVIERDGVRLFELRGVPGAMPADCRIGILDDPE